MNAPLIPCALFALEDLSSSECSALLNMARVLKHGTPAGAMSGALRGKKLGLVGASEGVASACFRQAAQALGAHVAEFQPGLTELSTPQDVQDTARLIGRLYDAVDCVGMPSWVVRRIGMEAGIPVYDGLSSMHGALAAQLDDGGDVDLNRMYIIQAALLSTIA